MNESKINHGGTENTERKREEHEFSVPSVSPWLNTNSNKNRNHPMLSHAPSRPMSDTLESRLLEVFDALWDDLVDPREAFAGPGGDWWSPVATSGTAARSARAF